MRRFDLFLVAIVLTVWSYPTSAASIDELIAASKREGVINLHISSALGPKGAQELVAAFNKKYRLNIAMNYFPSSSFSKDTGKVLTAAAMGVPQEWDVMTVTESFHAQLASRKLHIPFNYRALGVDPKAIHHNNGSITISHAMQLPAYNSRLLAPGDIPRTWADLLDARWKDGKLGVSDSTVTWAVLAAGRWGEEKTTDFVRRIAGQRPVLGREAELYTRLQLGEVYVAVTLPDNRIYTAQKTGAPIAHAEQIEPVVVTAMHIAVVKGAAHPNTGHLFAAFMTTAEAQEIWERYRGQTSAFVPGTKTNKFLEGKEAVFMGAPGQEPELVEKLSKEYSRILGFAR